MSTIQIPGLAQQQNRPRIPEEGVSGMRGLGRTPLSEEEKRGAYLSKMSFPFMRSRMVSTIC